MITCQTCVHVVWATLHQREAVQGGGRRVMCSILMAKGIITAGARSTAGASKGLRLLRCLTHSVEGRWIAVGCCCVQRAFWPSCQQPPAAIVVFGKSQLFVKFAKLHGQANQLG